MPRAKAVPEIPPEPKHPNKKNQTSWKKGHSGNPSGRFQPKAVVTEAPELKPKTLGKGTLEALRAEINKFDPVIMRRLKKIVQSPYFNKVRPEVVIRACELLLAYEYGRPKAREESKGQGSVQDFLAFLTAAQNQARLMMGAGNNMLPQRDAWVPRPILPAGVEEAPKGGNGRIIDAEEDAHAS